MNRLLRSPVLALLSLAATSLFAASPDTPADHGPKVISATQPVLPRPVFDFGKTGQVGVTFTITADGSVADIKVRSCNDALLEKPVIDAIKQWIFSPAVKNGQAVAVQVKQSFSFESPESTPGLPKDLPAAKPASKAMVATAK